MIVNAISRGVIRWAARVTGAGSLAFLSLFVGAHIFGDTQGPAPTEGEWIGLTFFPGGVLLGLIVAFFRPNAGGLTALGSLAAFYLWNVAQGGSLPGGPWFLLLTSPAVLFLLSAWLDGRTKNRAAHRTPRT